MPQPVPQTEVLDGTAWKDAADMPTPREHLAAVSDGTCIGGANRSTHEGPVAAAEALDFR